MTQPDLKKSKYQEHLKAVAEHKALVEQLETHDSDAQLDQIKFSLDKLALTLEEYFKVIGVP